MFNADEEVTKFIHAIKSGKLYVNRSIHQRIRTNLESLNNESVIEMLQKLDAHCAEGIIKKDPLAFFIRGFFYHFGYGQYTCDITAAMEYYDKACSMEDPNVMNIVGDMYQSGYEGIPIKVDAAVALYDKAIIQNHTSAMKNRACLYALGLGGAIDFPNAVALIYQAKKLENSDAINSQAEAISLIDPAVKQKYAEAIFLCAINGKSEQDTIAFCKSADELSPARLIFEIANMYHQSAVKAPATYQRFCQPFFLKEVRLHRRAAMMGDKDAQKAIQDSGEVREYHHMMYQKKIKEAVRLVLRHEKLLREFIEFDCKDQLLADPSHIKYIKAFIDGYTTFDVYHADDYKDYKTTQLCLNVLLALEGYETELEEGSARDVMLLKKELLFKLKLTFFMNEDSTKITKLMQIMIDTWCYFTNDEWSEEIATMTTEAVKFLEQAMHGLEFYKIQDSMPLNNMALILVKNMWGPEYGIDRSDLSIEHVNLLKAFNKPHIKKPPIETINDLLGIKGCIFHKQVKAAPLLGASQMGIFSTSQEIPAPPTSADAALTL